MHPFSSGKNINTILWKTSRVKCSPISVRLRIISLLRYQISTQAKAYNKGIIKLIKRKIKENPRRWHTLLNEALWSYQMACHRSTKVSPYQLVYGHDAVLPWEIKTLLGRSLFKINWLPMTMLL